MRFRTLILAGLVAAGPALATGCGMGDQHSGGTHSATSTGSSAAATSVTGEHNEADIAFATGMIPHHQQAVEMAQLVPDRSKSPEIADLARRISTAQQPEIEQMTTWLRSWEAPLPSTAASEHGGHGGMPGMMTADQMQQLGTLAGIEFDRLWLQMMIVHHQGAVEMARTELADGSNVDAKALAQQIIDAQQTEISEMQQLLPQG